MNRISKVVLGLIFLPVLVITLTCGDDDDVGGNGPGRDGPNRSSCGIILPEHLGDIGVIPCPHWDTLAYSDSFLLEHIFDCRNEVEGGHNPAGKKVYWEEYISYSGYVNPIGFFDSIPIPLDSLIDVTPLYDLYIEHPRLVGYLIREPFLPSAGTNCATNFIFYDANGFRRAGIIRVPYSLLPANGANLNVLSRRDTLLVVSSWRGKPISGYSIPKTCNNYEDLTNRYSSYDFLNNITYRYVNTTTGDYKYYVSKAIFDTVPYYHPDSKWLPTGKVCDRWL